MLGRIASSLFWMSRQIERAENISRLAEVGFRITLTPDTGDGHREEWRSTLTSAGVNDAFMAKHGEIKQDTALDFLLFDPDNPSSVRSCLESARTNARTVRTEISRDMWEALNSTWLAFQAQDRRVVTGTRLPEFLDWIRERTALFRGALLGTMLRNDAYFFSQLGAFLERADNTARIIDVKYYILLPSNQLVGGDMDTYQWETILRSVSAHRSYRHVYRDSYRPWNVAEFLTLHPEMPRSLRFSYDWINRSLSGLTDAYGSRPSSYTFAAETAALLHGARIQTILRDGFHEFILDFLSRNGRLTQALAQDYNFS